MIIGKSNRVRRNRYVRHCSGGRFIILLLAAAVIMPYVFSSCSSQSGAGNDGIESGVQNDTVSSAASETAELTAADLLAKAKSELPSYDYDNDVFVIADRNDGPWITVDTISEKENGEPINDAVFKRNQIIEEQFNIQIRESGSPVPADTVKKQCLANEDAYDLVTDGLNVMSGLLAGEKLLYDLYTVKSLNLTADYWDQSMNEGLSVINKLYYTTGDISIMDNYGTWCIMFNKAYVTDFQLDDPYQLVNDGKWTYDALHEIGRKVSADLNGDSKMGPEDRYGLLTEAFNTYGFWAGSGEKVVSKDKDDIPYLTAMNERSMLAAEKVIALQSDKSASADSSVFKGDWSAVHESIKGGRAFCRFGGMKTIGMYRDSDMNFGILPCPKLNEEQEKYYNTYSFCNCTAYGIPITVQDIERTGTVFDAMAKISKYTLTPAYTEVSLKGRDLRDNESEGMIDLILKNRIYDLASLYNFGGSYSMFERLGASKKKDFASSWAKIEPKAQKELDEFIELLNEQPDS